MRAWWQSKRTQRGGPERHPALLVGSHAGVTQNDWT
jgi:hypothetical protein